MNIRPLIESDLDAVWELRLESLLDAPAAFGSTHAETIARGKESWRNRLLPDQDQFRYFGAFAPHLAGMICLYREGGVRARHKATIISMFVQAAHRRAGMGRALLTAAIAHARSTQEFEQIHLAVVTTNSAARNLYLSLGFETYGTEPRAQKLEGGYLDEDLMVLML